MKARSISISPHAQVGLALVGSSLISFGLYEICRHVVHVHDFGYMFWNLMLAWTPLVVTVWLERILRTQPWSGWYALVVTGLWLAFLPNSFYMVTDFIHLRDVSDMQLMSVLVMLSSYIFTGVLIGFVSVYAMHRQLAKRLSGRSAFLVVELVLLVCSFAIYIGRELRWNSWDIVTDPFSVLFDVTDRLMSPTHYPDMWVLTGGFFAFLTGFYVVMWYVTRAIRTRSDL